MGTGGTLQVAVGAIITATGETKRGVTREAVIPAIVALKTRTHTSPLGILETTKGGLLSGHALRTG